MWIKVHYNININNTFTCLEFSNLILFEQKYVSIFWKDENYKIICGIQTDDLQIRIKCSKSMRFAVVSNFERE